MLYDTHFTVAGLLHANLNPLTIGKKKNNWIFHHSVHILFPFAFDLAKTRVETISKQWPLASDICICFISIIAIFWYSLIFVSSIIVFLHVVCLILRSIINFLTTLRRGLVQNFAKDIVVTGRHF